MIVDSDRPLEPDDLGPDPVAAFQAWFELAGEVGEQQPSAMALATAGEDGAPDVRFVLLHRAAADGFRFFTNYESAKAAQLEANPRAALAFHWPLLHRQVRLRGRVSRTGADESLLYWEQRPHGSRISAAASPQSLVIPGRSVLEESVSGLEARFPQGPPLPDFWGGYVLTPDRAEFWQGRTHRLHDRLLYVRREVGWSIDRLAP